MRHTSIPSGPRLFNPKKQLLDVEALADERAPHLIAAHYTRHSMQEFSAACVQDRASDHYVKFMTMGEGEEINTPKNRVSLP